MPPPIRSSKRFGRWLFFSTILHALMVLHVFASPTVSENAESITIHVGSGTNVSYLAFVEASLNAKPIIYAWHYDGFTQPDGTPRTGYDLFNAVAEETTGTPWALSYTTGAFGLTTSFQIGSVSSRTVNPLTSPVWTYWIQGGSEFVAWGDYDEVLQDYPSFTFWVGNSLIVSPSYWDTRYISNGSYDIWSIASFSYTGAVSDTHYYTDTEGKTQPVTFGTYGGPAPVLRKPPTVVSTATLPADYFQVVFDVVEGGIYQLEEQDGLTSNSWQILETPFVATTTQKTFTLPMNNPSKRGFFRLTRKE